MVSRKHIFTAIAGLAVLALPVSALAGHRFDNDDQREYVWRGDDHHKDRHEGWRDRFEDRHDGWRDRREDQRERRRDWFEDGRRGRWGQMGPGWYGTPAARPPLNYYAPVYRPYSGPGYQYRRDYEDDDGCGESYSSFEQSPPSAMNLDQQRSWLIARRQRAMYVIAQLRARHDSRGAGRVANSVKALNREIGAIDRRAGYGYSPAYRYAPIADYAPVGSYAPFGTYPAAAGPYSGVPYGPPSYYPNPALSAFSAIALPLLTGIR